MTSIPPPSAPPPSSRPPAHDASRPSSVTPSSTARTIAVHAYAIADTLALRPFVQTLTVSADVQVNLSSKTHVMLQYGEDQYLVAHDFGSLVFVGVPTAERERVMALLLGVVGKQAKPLFVEDFSVVVDPAIRPVVQFDRLLLDRFTPACVELLALVIGQSAAMEYYEADVDRILGRIDELANEFVMRGAVRRGLRPLIRFIGEAMRLRNRVIFTLALLDSPAAAWDDEVLDRLYRELRSSFAIEDRYRALDHKLSVIRDNLELIVDLTQQKRSMMLEISIVVLIGVEIVLFLIK